MAGLADRLSNLSVEIAGAEGTVRKTYGDDASGWEPVDPAVLKAREPRRVVPKQGSIVTCG